MSIVSELFLGATILQRKTVGLPSNMVGLEEILSPSLSQVGWTINISIFYESLCVLYPFNQLLCSELLRNKFVPIFLWPG